MNHELSALIRTSADTIKAFRNLRRAKQDEASEAVMDRYRKALSKALEAQEQAVVRLSQSAKRPAAPRVVLRRRRT